MMSFLPVSLRVYKDPLYMWILKHIHNFLIRQPIWAPQIIYHPLISTYMSTTYHRSSSYLIPQPIWVPQIISQPYLAWDFPTTSGWGCIHSRVHYRFYPCTLPLWYLLNEFPHLLKDTFNFTVNLYFVLILIIYC